MKSWEQWLAKAFAVSPYIVAGVGQIHSDAPASTKTQLATEALKVATGVADTVAPEFAPAINAAAAAAQEIIGLFEKHRAADPTASAATPAPAGSALTVSN